MASIVFIPSISMLHTAAEYLDTTPEYTAYWRGVSKYSLPVLNDNLRHLGLQTDNKCHSGCKLLTGWDLRRRLC